MKKSLLFFGAILLSIFSFAQAPEGFKYQAVVRDAALNILGNQTVGMRLTIQQGTIGGSPVYTETFAQTTNAYGLVNLEIGTGTTTDNFATIDWPNGPYFIETAIDITGGTTYTVMGTNQLMSVPYALHAKTAETALTDNVDDADNDPSNEHNTGVSLSGTTLSVTDAGGAQTADLSSLQDGTGTDDQNISGSGLAGTNLTIGIEGGTPEVVDLSTLQDGTGTDDQNISGSGLAGTNLTIGIEGGTPEVIDLSALQDGVTDADADPANEIQALSIVGDQLTISGGNTITVPSGYGKYAFHASASIDQSVGDTAYDTLRCNNSSSGENFEYPAGVYDNTSFAFIAPEDGIYFFEAATLWDNANSSETRNAIFIRVNNTDEVGEWAASGGTDFFGVGVSTTLELNVGDQVRIRVYNGDSMSMDTFSQSGKYCYFSGYMLFPN